MMVISKLMTSFLRTVCIFDGIRWKLEYHDISVEKNTLTSLIHIYKIQYNKRLVEPYVEEAK